jgi:hypothetical protein
MKKSQATVCGSNSFNASLALAMMVPATCFCGIILLECGTRIILDWWFEVLRSLYGNAIEVVYIQHFTTFLIFPTRTRVASRKRRARRSRLDMLQFCNSVLKGKGELPSDTLGASELTKDKLPIALRGIQHTRTRRIQPTTQTQNSIGPMAPREGGRTGTDKCCACFRVVPVSGAL